VNDIEVEMQPNIAKTTCSLYATLRMIQTFKFYISLCHQV